MFHDDFSVAIPLFGSDGQKLSQLAKLATLKMKIATFRTRVANPGTRSKCGWRGVVRSHQLFGAFLTAVVFSIYRHVQQMRQLIRNRVCAPAGDPPVYGFTAV